MSARRNACVFAVCAICAGGVAGGSAHAQRLTSGLYLPTGDVAAGVHAENQVDNPASLGFGQDFDLTLFSLATPHERIGAGTGFFAGLGVLDPYHVGFSVQLLDQPGFQRHEPVKIGFHQALRLGEGLSFGLGYSVFSDDGDSGRDGLSTWDAGLTWQPWRWVSTAVVVTDMTTPRVHEAPLVRGWDFGLALRPGTERFTLSGAARLEESGGANPTYGARLDWNFWGPVGLVARYDTTELGPARVHTVTAGFTDQIGSKLGFGLFGFTPDVTDKVGDKTYGIGTLVRAGTAAEPVERPQIWHNIVEVGLTDALPEYAAGGFFSSTPRTPFYDTLRTLRTLAHSSAADAVLLSLTEVELGWAQAEELRTVIAEVRAAGKLVLAYVPVGDTKSYYIATACDRIYSAPSGGIFLTGLRGDHLYIKTLLDKIGVSAQFVAIGDYKSAPEMFTREGPSPAATEAENGLLDPLYAQVVQAIADARKKTPDAIKALVDAGPYTAKGAQAAGLVDGIVQYDEFQQIFTQTFGARIRFVEPAAVLHTRDPRWGELPRIALLYASGTITDGESMANPLTSSVSTGADTFIQAVRALREDRNVAAVVLRIDSPGGSVTASDVMWRELHLLGEQKPLYVSMGDVAASGGYYIAAAGERIFADSATITGSIGIFTGKFDLTGLYTLLGLHFETFKRGARADFMGTTRPWTEDEVKTVRSGMEELYALFLQRVVDGRKGLKTEQVDAIGRGRVWLGSQARERGLVDMESGLLATLDAAADRVGLDPEDYIVEAWPRGDGMGGLPRSPVLSPPALLARLFAPAETRVQSGLTGVFETLLDLPLLHFQSGQALALLPYVDAGR